MKYKVGDLVYFYNAIKKGVGEVVSIDGNHILVNSNQINGGHDGNGHVEKQDNDNNWWFMENLLKPFTKKVGQKYKVIHNSVEDAEVRIGGVITLDSVEDDKLSYYCNENVSNFVMYDLDHPKCEVEFYEDVEDAEEHKENKMFTKEDLKVGYLVKLRSGEFAHVVDTTKYGICINFENKWNTLRAYNNDLTHKNTDSRDIIEVYGYTLYGYHAHKFEVGNRELLWKREEVKEMTIEDIQKALGHRIKVVE